MTQPGLDPSHIMQVGMGFFGSRTLLTAVELDLFTHLRAGKLTGEAIAQRLRLHPRAIPDFPDALVALGVLEREGDGPEALYGYTTDTAVFLALGPSRATSRKKSCSTWSSSKRKQSVRTRSSWRVTGPTQWSPPRSWPAPVRSSRSSRRST